MVRFILAALVVRGGADRLRGLEYDYSNHGQDWSAGSCSSRVRQSPIDLPAEAGPNGHFAFKYSTVKAPFEFQNNGHTLSADFAGQGYGGVYYENAWYNLMNVNLHAQSEHTWDGKPKPVEIHMVHKRYDSGALLVIAVGVEAGAGAAAAPGPAAASMLQLKANLSGPAPAPGPAHAPGVPYIADGSYTPPAATDEGFNPLVQAFLKVAPPDVKMKVLEPLDTSDVLDLNALVGAGSQFYEYAGSTTAPPCTENTLWLVRKDTIPASSEQIRYLHDFIFSFTAEFGNFRSVMPLNGREVYLREAKQEDEPPTISPEVPTLPPSHSDREFRAMKWAKDALRMARSATDYIKDLDYRLRAAATAHAAALAPKLKHRKKRFDPTKMKEQATKAGASLTPGMTHAEQKNTGPTPKQIETWASQIASAMAKASKAEVNAAITELGTQAGVQAVTAAQQAADIVENGLPAPEQSMEAPDGMTS